MEVSSQDPSAPRTAAQLLPQGLTATTCPGGAGSGAAKKEGSRKGEAASWEASALPSQSGGTPSPQSRSVCCKKAEKASSFATSGPLAALVNLAG